MSEINKIQKYIKELINLYTKKEDYTHIINFLNKFNVWNVNEVINNLLKDIEIAEEYSNDFNESFDTNEILKKYTNLFI